MVTERDPEELEPEELFQFSSIQARKFPFYKARSSSPQAPRWLPCGVIQYQELESLAKERKGGEDTSEEEVAGVLGDNMRLRTVVICNEFQSATYFKTKEEALVTRFFDLDELDIASICSKLISTARANQGKRWWLRVSLSKMFKYCDVFITNDLDGHLPQVGSWKTASLSSRKQQLVLGGENLSSCGLDKDSSRAGSKRFSFGIRKSKVGPALIPQYQVKPGERDPGIRGPQVLDEENIRKFLALGDGVPLRESIDLVRDTGRFANYHHLILARTSPGVETTLVRFLSSNDPASLCLDVLESLLEMVHEQGEENVNEFLHEKYGEDLVSAQAVPTF